MAEGIEDLHDCLKKYGKRIVNRLMDHGLLGPKTITAHCIYVNEQEMDLLKDTDTMVTHSPELNMPIGVETEKRIQRRGIFGDVQSRSQLP